MSFATIRQQRTINQPAEVSGFGLFGGADVLLRFLPADIDHGIAFQRTDVKNSKPIAATIDNLTPSHRRTVISKDGVKVEMIEHVMAALAGLQIDNCLIEIDNSEVPGLDGSCKEICDRLLDAGIVEQDARRSARSIHSISRVKSDDGHAEIMLRPHVRPTQAVTYLLDYGHRSPVPPQMFSTEVTPESFVRDIAFARTFVLESEIEALQAAGYGKNVTAQNLLVFRDDGTIVDNHLRAPNECVRHKILDCIGDFALLGTDIHGHFSAWRSGHSMNHRTVSHLQNAELSEPKNQLKMA